MALPLPALLQQASLEHLQDTLAQYNVSELRAKLEVGRPALLQFLKEAGVSRLGDRQKLANTLAKAERESRTNVEQDVQASGAEPKVAVGAASTGDPDSDSLWLKQAEALKQTGNAAFKAQRNKEAVKAWVEALDLARQAKTRMGSSSTLAAVVVSLHSNTAAAHLRMAQWNEAATSAGSALELEPAHAKALYRRGVARARLGDRVGARKDLQHCIKVDAKNKEAREALAELVAKEKEANDAAAERAKAEMAEQVRRTQASAAEAASPSPRHDAASKPRPTKCASGVDADGIEHISTETMVTLAEWNKQHDSAGG